MTRLQIDFAPRSLRRALFRLHAGVWAGALLGLALCLGAALTSWQLAQQRAQREQSMDRQGARARAVVRVPVATAAPLAPEQASAVNGAIRQLNLPWRELEEAVAAATPATVALLALEPDANKQVLKISAETGSGEAMVAYIEQLKQQEFFSEVILLRHDINERDPNRPLRFQLQARWRTP